MTLTAISRRLSKQVNALQTEEAAAYTYNPLDYARAPHEAYLEKWGKGPKQAILLGMNPGPFGMTQTGVPFGDVAMVRDFVGVTGRVKKPVRQHPKRPIDGFDCPRGEVSGTRLWGWAKDEFGTAEAFFDRFFVVNYCPLVFMEDGGKNLTPDKLPAILRDPLFEACDAALRDIVAELSPRWVIGIGGFARKQADRALKGVETGGEPVRLGTVLHPSPASPAANRGWAPQASAQLHELGLL